MKRALFLVVIFLTLQFFFLVPVSLVNTYVPQLANSSALLSMASLLPQVTMVVLLHRMGYFTFQSGMAKPKLCSAWAVLLSFLAFAVLVVGTGLLSEVIGLPDINHDTFQNMLMSPLGIVAVVVGGPVCEEFLFRGAIQGHLLSNGMGAARSIIIAAVLFALIHMNPAQMLSAFIMGTFFGWVAYRSGSIALALMLHVTNNLCGTLLFRYGVDDESAWVDDMGMAPTLVMALVLICVGGGVAMLLNREFCRIEQKD